MPYSVLSRLNHVVSRFVSAGTPDAVSHFEAALFPPIQYMLSADVSGKTAIHNWNPLR